MTDSIAVFPPGYRLTDNTTGDPLAGGVVYFYDAGTTTPKTVYSDLDLLTSLGTSVTCDSLGRPTSDGTSPTQIYVGTASYKVIVKDSTAATIETKDNIKGAYATFAPSSLTVIATTPVVTKSLNYTVVSGDQSTVFVGNCSSGDVTFTLPSAVTVGTGWFIDVQHAGTANQIKFATVSSQTISEGSTSFGTAYVLTFNGEAVRLVSDGGNWRISNHSSPFIQSSQGVLPIVSRTNTPPGTPADGDMHILTASPTGAWSTFAQHDIAKYTGSAWVKFTPPSNSGWVAWVQGETIQYRYSGTAWVAESATTALAGTVRLADAAAMEARTASRGVTADIQHRHPTHPKAWIAMDGTGTAAIRLDDGFASITDNGTGDYSATMDTAMSSVNYAVALGGSGAGAGGITVIGLLSAAIPTTTVIRLACFGYNSGGFNDCSYVTATVTGDH